MFTFEKVEHETLRRSVCNVIDKLAGVREGGRVEVSKEAVEVCDVTLEAVETKCLPAASMSSQTAPQAENRVAPTIIIFGRKHSCFEVQKLCNFLLKTHACGRTRN